MIFYAHCRACGTHWKVVPPLKTPLELGEALSVMEAGLCPDCGNDGAKAPVNWRFTFWGRQTTAEVRPKTTRPTISATGEGDWLTRERAGCSRNGTKP